MPNKTPLEREVNRLKVLFYSICAAVVIIFSMLVYGLSLNSQAIQQAHTAICTLKQNDQRQIRSTTHFLKQHPKGIPGVPNKLLLQGVEQTKQQLNAFKNISCS